MRGNGWLDPTLGASPLFGGDVALWCEHCFAPAPHIFVILKATPIPQHPTPQIQKRILNTQFKAPTNFLKNSK